MSWIELSFQEENKGFSPPPKKPKTNEVEIDVLPFEKEHGNYSHSENWLKKYKPQKIEELGVQIGLVKQLEKWLLHPYNKLLLITGPTGCGKTTTLEIVSKKLGFKLLEWINPVSKFETCNEIKQFERFLLCTSRYNSCLGPNNIKTVILVKDFPNKFLLNTSAFHEVLENVSYAHLNNPVVFICSEGSLCRKLFFSNTKCKLPVLRFNAITSPQMLRILKTIINKERQINENLNILCDRRLSVICASSKGDIRCSVSNLYFQCVSPSVERNPKTPEKSPPLLVGTPEKDVRIGFFKGIGEVLSPKKSNPLVKCKFTATPENLIERFLGEAQSFICRLNDNLYSKFNQVNDISRAAERLATSDILLSRWQERDVFQEYALSVAVRGTIVSNTDPQEQSFQFYGKENHLQKTIENVQLECKLLFPDLLLQTQCVHEILPYLGHLRDLSILSPSQKNYLNKVNNF